MFIRCTYITPEFFKLSFNGMLYIWDASSGYTHLKCSLCLSNRYSIIGKIYILICYLCTYNIFANCSIQQSKNGCVRNRRLLKLPLYLDLRHHKKDSENREGERERETEIERGRER